MSYIWVEKYRPKNVSQIIQQEEIKVLLQQVIEKNNLTHMLFFGPSGTGKTSTALALAKQLFYISKSKNEDIWEHYKKNEKIFNERVLELNASDERGIKVVREKIKNFASASIHKINEIPNFKIIILDEADAMTSDSQFALRRIIEKYTNMTRFILICNYVTRIISPLASRCAKIRFQSISQPSIKQIINKISKKENIIIENGTIQTLHNITKGDLRKSINLLQRASFLSNKIDSKTILDISGYISPKEIDKIWIVLSNKNNSIQNIIYVIKQCKKNAFSSIHLLNCLFEKVINSLLISNDNKINLINIMSNIDFCLNDNANEYIQLIKLCISIKNSLY